MEFQNVSYANEIDMEILSDMVGRYTLVKKNFRITDQSSIQEGLMLIMSASLQAFELTKLN